MKKLLGKLLLLLSICYTLHASSYHDKPILTGDFSIEMQVEKNHLEALEPLHLSYTITAKKHIPPINTLLPHIKGVESFVDIQNITDHQKRFVYTLVSDKNFTIPALSLKCFSPDRQEHYTLKTPAQHITITAANIPALVDASNSFREKGLTFSDISPYLKGLFFFILGYLIATLNLPPLRKK